ncbi:MAG: hypothetical protein WCW13_06310 [archaeon]|jgi:hypothetical protein
MRKLFLCSLLLFLSIAVMAFSASDGNYDLNLVISSDLGSNATSPVFDTNFISSDYSAAIATSADYNVELGVYFPSAPTVSISVPPNNSSTTLTSFNIIYSSSDLDNDVVKYWVKIDDSNWIDNGLNLSYLFSNLSIGSHVLSVKAIDSYNFSGDSNITVLVNPVESFFWIKTSGFDLSSIIVSLTSSTLGSSILGLNSSFFSGLRLAFLDEVQTNRRINWGGSVYSDSTVFSFVVNVKNVSGRALRNVHVVERIPKEVAFDINKLIIEQSLFRILQTDPTIEWVIKELAPGEDKNFYYSVSGLSEKNKVSDANAFFSSVPAPSALLESTVQEINVCEKITCDDNNPCTFDSCSLGKCVFSYDNNAFCGEGKACYSGACLNKEFAIAQNGLAGKESTISYLFFIFVVIVILSCVVVLFKFRLKKQGL